MSTPELVGDRIADMWVTPNTPVLQRRPVFHTPDVSTLPQFSDPVWDLYAAVPDRHSSRTSIHWERFPKPFRHACKLYVFALINIVDHAPRLASAAASIPSIKTIVADLTGLRQFVRYLANRGLRGFPEVTTAHLDHYLGHVIKQPATAQLRNRMLVAVQRLHIYKETVPDSCRLPIRTLWGGSNAYDLIGQRGSARHRECRTPRIHPDVMHPLLSAALLVIDTIATDIRPATTQLVALRVLALRLGAPLMDHRRGAPPRGRVARDHLERLLSALEAQKYPLPGRDDGEGTVVDLHALALAGVVEYDALRRSSGIAILARSDLPIQADLLRVPNVSTVDGRPWRDQPVEAAELPNLIRHVTAACYIVIAYLSGIRVGEVLNLQRGCVSHDATLGLHFLSGRQLKASPDRAERSPATIPWVINEQGAKAISVLEDLAPSSVLFPGGVFGSPLWLQPSQCRKARSINTDIKQFIGWFNAAIAPAIGHAAIGADEHGSITGRRLRRTLAWHIVRRPGGTIAGATQYGHLYTQITHGYAGKADSGFLDEISFEEFLLRTEQLHDDLQQLDRREHVSGPAADLYRHRVTAGAQFNGLTISTPAQARITLANSDLQVHHGSLLTCVWRPETAACRNKDTDPAAGPAWSKCRLNCGNIAYTDRDVSSLRRHVDQLRMDLDMAALPKPLHQRLSERLSEHQRAVDNHHATRP